jgi:hypothetical protein
MIFNTTNIVIFCVLLAANLLAILISNRKRKFGLFPSKLFLVLFIALWIGKIVVYFYVDKKVQDYQLGEIQVLGDFKEYSTGKSVGYVTKGLKTSSIKSVYYLRYIIRIATIQSIIAMFLSLYGLIAVYNRNPYYAKMLGIHFLAVIFCLGMELNII